MRRMVKWAIIVAGCLYIWAWVYAGFKLGMRVFG